MRYVSYCADVLHEAFFSTSLVEKHNIQQMNQETAVQNKEKGKEGWQQPQMRARYLILPEPTVCVFMYCRVSQ